MDFPRSVRRLQAKARLSLLGFDVLRQTQVLRHLSLAGLAEFARTGLGRPVGPQQLVHWFACHAPERPALVCGETRLTYGALDARTNQLAHGLRALGVGAGARVAMMLENCVEYVELQHALLSLGAAAVQIGYRLKPAEVRFILENSGARVVVHGPLQAPVVAQAIEGLEGVRVVAVRGEPIPHGEALRYEELLAGNDAHAAPRPDSAGASGGLMVYTSGTTGRPKGAYRDAAGTGLEPALSFIRQIPLTSDDRHLCGCPLYHSAGPAFVELTFAVGGAVVLMPHFDPAEWLRLVEDEAISSSMLVPTMLQRVLSLPDEAFARFDHASLRWIMSGAAPLSSELAAQAERRFGPILYNFYGATETGFVTLALPGEHTARPETIGRPVGGIDIRLLDEAGRDVPPGEVGELYVRSPMLVRGYHGDEAATVAARREGYFSVGDLGRRDAEGYYYLVDRKHDMVISGGVNIYPREIEERLLSHPAVEDVAVVGELSPEWGESLCAFVVRRTRANGEPVAVSADELREHVRGTLADFKRPRKVVYVPALPRNPTGKILKRELRSWAAQATDGGWLALEPAERSATGNP